MFIRKLYIVVGLVLALGFFFEIMAHAEDSTQEITIRFGRPVQIPGQVLPAGTYLFRPADFGDSVVQIFNADRTRLYATVQTIAVQRPITDEDLVITVAAPNSSDPNFLVKWFYPGSLVGHEFVYSGGQQQQIAEAPSRTSIGSELPDGTLVGANEQ